MRAATRVLSNADGPASADGAPGGATRFGISRRDYPHLDLTNLARGSAIAIYFQDFWRAGHFPELPPTIAIKLFDLSVDMGAAHATECLQRALRACGNAVLEDGALGNGTVAAAHRAEGPALLAALRSEAAGYYRALADKSVGVGADERARFLAARLDRAYQ